MTSPEQLAPSPQEKPSHRTHSPRYHFKGLAQPPHTDPTTFTRLHGDNSVQKRPQAIAHRGHCAEYPENTMSAFTAAVKAGAHAIETDMHLSKDGVVVLSHVRLFEPPARNANTAQTGRYAETMFRQGREDCRL